MSGFEVEYRRAVSEELSEASVKSPYGTFAFQLDEVFSVPTLQLIAPREMGARVLADTSERRRLSGEDLLATIDEHRRVLLQASAGSGKSLMLRWLARSASRRGWSPFLLKATEWEEGDGESAASRFTEFVVRQAASVTKNDPTTRLEVRRLLREGDQQLYLLDGLDEILDPDARSDLWKSWEAFLGEAAFQGLRRGLVSLRPEGFLNEIVRSDYRQLELLPPELKKVGELASTWARALDLADPEGFRSEVLRMEGKAASAGGPRGEAQVFVNPMWIMIAAQVWRSSGRLPGSRYGLFEEYALALLRRDHRPTVGVLPTLTGIQREMRLAARIAREVWKVSRGAASSGGLDEVRGGGPRVAAARAREILLAEADKGSGASREEVREILTRWTSSGGLVEYAAARVPPDGFFFFQRQILDFLLAFDAGVALSDFLASGSKDRWPAVVEDEQQRQIYDFLPHRLMSLVKDQVLDLHALFQRLEEHSLKGLQQLVVGYLLERLLDDTPEDERHRDWAEWKEKVRDLLAASFPLDYTKRLQALKEIPEGIRVRAAESLARLGDPRTELLDPTKMQFVRVPGGKCTLAGTPDRATAGPRTKDVEPFEMARFPVTMAQYSVFLQSPAAKGALKPLSRGVPTTPVTGMSLTEADAFCTWLSGELGRKVRLPDEFEWEWAANGAREAADHPPPRLYPWSNEEPNSSLANFGYWRDRPTPLGCYPLGGSLHDSGAIEEMAGNVYEWTSSEAIPRDSRNQRMVCGGSFESGPLGLRAGARYRNSPGRRLSILGLRVVVTL